MERKERLTSGPDRTIVGLRSAGGAEGMAPAEHVPH